MMKLIASNISILCLHWVGTSHRLVLCVGIYTYTPCTTDFSWVFWYGTLPCPFTFEGAKLNECCRTVQVLCLNLVLVSSSSNSYTCIYMYMPTQRERGTCTCMYSIGPFFRGKQFSRISAPSSKIKTANCMVGMVNGPAR